MTTLILGAAAFLATPADARVELGIDVLQANDFSVLHGKRVGLITNQTGVNSKGELTRLILRKAPRVKLVALFTPEHGLDGKELAGKYVATRKDPLTGLTAHSLYGPTRKPTAAMLKGIDALVYDMQDIGCRSYTYISTMIRSMEAAGEHGLEFIVLDRPNPLGGLRVEGPPIETRWLSFVGQVPVPYVHGLTAGEIARMANALGWVKPRVDLKVVNMRGWSRSMTWADTGLRWIRTSPNIPNAMSPFYYVVTGIAGSLSGLDIGIGTPEAFQMVGAGWLNLPNFARHIESLKLDGVRVAEVRHNGSRKLKLEIDPHARADLCALAVHILAELNRNAKPDLFARSSASKLDIFYKVYGSQSIRSQLAAGVPPSRIIASWSAANSRFQSERRRYLLY